VQGTGRFEKASHWPDIVAALSRSSVVPARILIFGEMRLGMEFRLATRDAEEFFCEDQDRF
jgi:hypothetical protein